MTGRGEHLRAWAELLRLPALFTVPGDALAGASAVGLRPGRGTFLAIGSSLCLYEAGMALNDWADRAEDAVDRPHRPLPSGRIRPAAALAAAGAFTAGGLALAHRAGRPATLLATALAGTVWAYDLGLKRTQAGPVAMAAARGLDVLLGAAATAPRCGQAFSKAMGDPSDRAKPRAWGRVGTAPGSGGQEHGLGAALPTATTIAAHILAVTTVSRNETQGGNTAAPLAALAASLTLARWTGRTHELPAGRRVAAAPGLSGSITTALAAAYAGATARPYFHAALNPSPPLTQRAVGAGIRSLIPLQAALAARAGAPRTALITAALAPLARRIAPKVSVT
ncbi:MULTISPECIES: SCO3242 family prenyltransferase [unclassified Streptomyces]|uniref:SCO3242 family prenyltransferase n=1 Tax=unclassified Streptomyces TaxID=2593676 RepID=UPI002DDBD49E|nr:UbiA family prenyltransferase [Streptomyces sp. NBC_01445]WSE04186.1 UbiA family prenyltransferase [Streptomyces sp. NBC_01445]